MALPNKINQSDPSGSADPGTLDTIIQTFKTAVNDIFGVANNTNVAAAAFSIDADGLKKVILQDAATNPTATGEIQRNGANLKYYDGSAARTILTDSSAITATALTLTAPIITPTAEGSLHAAGNEGKVIWLDDGPQGLVGDFGSAIAHLFGYNWIANAYTTLNAAITAISSTSATLVIGKSISVNANVTVPNNITLHFMGQGQLAIANAVTCTINGPIIAPPRQIFVYTGTGVAILGSTNRHAQAYVEWFGANTAETAANNTTYLNNACKFFPSGGVGILDFQGGTYQHNDTIQTQGRNLWFRGVGMNVTKLELTVNGSGNHGIQVTSTLKALRVTDMEISPSSAVASDNGQKAITADVANDGITPTNAIIEVERVKINGYNFGVYTEAGATQAMRFVHVKNCDILTQGASSASVSNCVTTSNVLLGLVEHCKLDNNNLGDHVIYSLHAQYAIARHNTMRNSVDEAVKYTHFTNGAGNDNTQYWAVIANDIQDCGGAANLTADSFNHDMLVFEHNTVRNCGGGAGSNAGAVVFGALSTNDPCTVKACYGGHNVFTDIDKSCIRFDVASDCTIEYATMPDLYCKNWGTDSAGTYRALDVVAAVGTRRKAYFSGYFDGNSNGRAASGASGLALAFADVDVGPLYITNCTEVENNDKKTRAGGSSATFARVIGLLHAGVTAASTAANTTETDLQSYSLPANTLSMNGRGLHIRAWGDTAANGNTKTIRLRFGGSIVAVNNVTTAPNNADWFFDVYIVRTGSNTQTLSYFLGVAATLQDVGSAAISETDTGSLVIRVTGQNGTASAGDITCRGMIIEVL